jgi:hypothetical protein
MLIKKVLPLAVLLGLSITGCEGPDIPSLPIEESELPGRYIGNFGETDINYIDILPDSVFVSYYKTKDGHLYIDTGTWKFLKTGFFEYDRLLVRDFIQRHPENCIDFPGKEKVLKEYNVDLTRRSLILIKSKDVMHIEYCYAKRQYYKKRFEEEKDRGD